MDTRRLAKFSLIWGGLFSLVAVSLPIGYYLYFRPRWASSEMISRVEAFLKDPSMQLDQIRRLALNGHNVLLASYAALDAAILCLIALSAVAAWGFFYLGIKLRRAGAGSKENAL
jgi:hypothetical protein